VWNKDRPLKSSLGLDWLFDRLPCGFLRRTYMTSRTHWSRYEDNWRTWRSSILNFTTSFRFLENLVLLKPGPVFQRLSTEEIAIQGIAHFFRSLDSDLSYEWRYFTLWRTGASELTDTSLNIVTVSSVLVDYFARNRFVVCEGTRKKSIHPELNSPG